MRVGPNLVWLVSLWEENIWVQGERERETPDTCTHTGVTMCGHGEQVAVYNPGREASEAKPADTWILDFQPPEPWENTFLLLSLPVCDILLWRPEQTKTESLVNTSDSLPQSSGAEKEDTQWAWASSPGRLILQPVSLDDTGAVKERFWLI